MELVNSNSEKKKQQLEVFSKYASLLTAEQQKLGEPYASGVSLRLSESGETGQPVLRYDDFVRLIANSQSLYSKFTDHSFNLNQIPKNVFGCIFFAMDEQNKGYLTINDWFHFNNILEYNNYHFIVLYEFFRKFDVARIRAQQTSNIDDQRVKYINYGNKFLSFDDLYLNVDQFKSTISLLQKCVNDQFVVKNNLALDWNEFRWFPFYQCTPHGKSSGSYFSLSSLVTILQTDLKDEKLFVGFERLCHLNPSKNCRTLSKNQISYLLKLFYSHRVSSDVFNSLDLTNTKLIKCDNNYIQYNVIKDIFYLFENFDLLNQVLIRYAQYYEFDESDVREQVITKRDFMEFMNKEYNKVTNIVEFSPSQINLLFSIVSNSKQSRHQYLTSMHHNDETIDDFIHRPAQMGPHFSKGTIKEFNENYNSTVDEFSQSSALQENHEKKHSHRVSLLDRLWAGKTSKDIAESRDLTMEDFMKILNPNYLNDIVHSMELKRIRSESWYSNFYFYPIFDSIHNFTLGSVAGCIGATIVYPIDLVKTRMQAQRNCVQFNSSIDCFVKIFQTKGIRGLYSGLGPQLIGVAPEKAIKLTVNDFMRQHFMNKSRTIKWYQEILSGATAGACQVIFTNPLEIVKIRLQMRSDFVGENGKPALGAIGIIRQLGLRGLYKGAAACMLRDIPFSAIYFPTYAHLKKDVFKFDPNDKNKRTKLKTWELLLAGAVAGMPAAYLTTPFDVIKTRLQIDPRKGETKYTGVIHAARTIFKEESIKSFFKGGPARVLRSSPQFGFTLAAFEMFQGLFPSSYKNNGSDIERGNSGNEGSSNTGGVRLRPDAEDDTPIVTSLFTTFYKNFKDDLYTQEPVPIEFYGPSVDPYSSNFLNYYYKSCQISKVFIDLDYNFTKFDFNVYQKFQKELKRIGTSNN
ncbi:unnamed protein product [Kluyveromyces dobzhanskii CBS 2104]|uniref:Mitochondrial aspartate-glutamate transporter AGC1 n=1 Tax=Kluyveromyces dobzhanskii CBS 2104 TaxID=1427455 RepID=A0A0A8L3C0_9SACH|nr:unnamed protein product [Kluyveromyces dobzhanskii CBS 2104]